jgi:MFS superfamily sulfate permease-like transporter
VKIFPERVDIVAGLSVAGLLLPEAVAYASIAGLPPQHALFAGVAGLVCYAIFGGSRFAIVSPTSSSAAIVAAAATSATTLSPDEFKLAVAGAVLLTGAFFVVAGLARFGSLSNFISRPVLKGFAFGIGVTIVAKQIVTICGVHGIAGNPFQIAAQMVERLGEVKPLSVIIGVAALSVLVLLKRLPSVPGAFVVLLAGIALSYATDLEGRGVALAGRSTLFHSRRRFPISLGKNGAGWDKSRYRCFSSSSPNRGERCGPLRCGMETRSKPIGNSSRSGFQTSRQDSFGACR